MLFTISFLLNLFQILSSTSRAFLLVISRLVFSGSFHPGETYNKSVSYKIPLQLPSDIYEIIIDTDYTNNVFEHIFDNNNQKKKQLNITQLVPDLTVESLAVSVNTDFIIGRTIVNVSWYVKNIGKGNLFSKSWTDRVWINFVGQSSFIKNLQDVSHRFDLNSGETYVFLNRSYIAPRLRNLRESYVHVTTDASSNIYEETETNNDIFSQKLTLPPIHDKLRVLKLHINQPELNVSDIKIPTVFAGSRISISWTVSNAKPYSTSSKSWVDAIYLLRDNSQDTNQYLLKTVAWTRGLFGNGSYSRTINVILPKNIHGLFSLRVDVDKSSKLLWEAGSWKSSVSKLNIKVPSTPNLIIKALKFQPVSFHSQGYIHSITVTWEVKNIGNSMQSTAKWKDEIVLSKRPGNPFTPDRLSLGFSNTEVALGAGQSYTQRKTVLVPSNAIETYYVNVIIDSDNSVNSVLQGSTESNDIRYNDLVYVVPTPEKPDLRIDNLVFTKGSLSSGDTIKLSYKVDNVGGTTEESSWTDIVYLEKKTHQTMVTQHVLTSKVHIGVLEDNESYTVELDAILPVFLDSGTYELFVAVDKYGTIQDSSGLNNVKKVMDIVIPSLSKPDLQALVAKQNMTSQSGQPISVAYNVLNNGPGQTYSNFPWYDTLFLSEDLILDQFDIRLTVSEQKRDLPPGSSFTNNITVNLPFDLIGKVYYLLLKTDSRNSVREVNENNNIDNILLNVIESHSTDLAVSSVTVPSSVIYGELTRPDWTWTVSNIGSKYAVGYKCDSVYLSSDKFWDMKDHELAVDCSFLTLSESGTLSSKKLFSVAPIIPLVSQTKYFTIVKTRSNIRDINKANNVGVSNKTTLVQHETLQLDLETSFKFPIYVSSKVWRIGNLPAGETLIIKIYSKATDPFIEVFVCHTAIVELQQFDAAAGQTLSANQTVVIPNTKQGDYYVMVSKVGSAKESRLSDSPSFMILAKVARLEITSVAPRQAAPIGQATLTVEGTLFPFDFEAHFSKNSSDIKLRPLMLYRYSSTKLFITVNVTNLAVGDVYNLQITNKINGNSSIYSNALTIISGLKGILSRRVQFPRALRLGEAANIIIDIQNTGDTDVILPMFHFSVGDTAVVSLPGSNRLLDNQRTFISTPSNGPRGILPPKTTARVLANVTQRNDQIGRVPIRLCNFKVSDKDENPYLKRKKAFQPAFYPDQRWDKVWSSFTKAVGNTTASLRRRLSETANNLGMLGMNVLSVDDLIEYELNLADGFHTGKSMHHVVDVAMKRQLTHFTSLRLSRYFSPKVSYRTVKGPFGYGWVAPIL